MELNRKSDILNVRMDTHFTPLDIAAFQQRRNKKEESKKSFDINVIFLTLIVITLIILSTLLFVLIQKKMQELALYAFFA